MEGGRCGMLAAVKGYYDGKQIVIDEKDRNNLNVGDEVIVTVLGQVNMQKTETRGEKRKRIIESDLYVASSGRTVEEIDEYIKELRDNDRF